MIRPEHGAAPHQLLLATDLSARCDRALNRAVQLTREWHAELVAMHVLDHTASPAQALAWVSEQGDEQLMQLARRQLCEELAAAQVPATLCVVRSQDRAGAIRDAAARMQAGLVVTGVSSQQGLGRLLLGSAVEKLACSLSQPLLVVRKPVHAAYRRIVVASDFSASSRHALQAAARFFPSRELILYHAHALAMAGLAKTAPGRADVGIEHAECAAFLAKTALPGGLKVSPVIEYGAIESALTEYVRLHDIDLVVLGSHGRSGLTSLLVGSTATKLLDWLPCDTLLVRHSANGVSAAGSEAQGRPVA